MKSPVLVEAQEFMRLTIPLASAQAAQAATGFVDTVMLGWLGQETLAAGGLASATFGMFLIATTGVLGGVSPLVAEAFGAGRPQRVQALTVQSLWLAVGLSIPVMVILGYGDWLLTHLGQPSNLLPLAKTYLEIMRWSFLPALLFATLKNVVSSLSQPRPILGIVVIGTLFNAIGNYVLGFGQFGFPALGISGIALASTLSWWLMLAGLIGYILVHPQLKTYQFFHHLLRIDLKLMQELLWVGVPIGVSFTLEAGLFTATTYLMGILGTEVLAAHQIVFQTIVVIFMVPLGMSFATTIRVGQWNGQHNLLGIRRAAYVSMICGVGFMTLMAIALLLGSRQVISLYLDLQDPANAQVAALAGSMLTVAALSQILDGVQTTAAGALRGLKDTRIPMLLSFVAFWMVGLSSGYLLGFQFGFSGVGLWWGQLLGVAVSAGFFLARFRKKLATYERAIANS